MWVVGRKLRQIRTHKYRQERRNQSHGDHYYGCRNTRELHENMLDHLKFLGFSERKGNDVSGWLGVFLAGRIPTKKDVTVEVTLDLIIVCLCLFFTVFILFLVVASHSHSAFVIHRIPLNVSNLSVSRGGAVGRLVFGGALRQTSIVFSPYGPGRLTTDAFGTGEL